MCRINKKHKFVTLFSSAILMFLSCFYFYYPAKASSFDKRFYAGVSTIIVVSSTNVVNQSLLSSITLDSFPLSRSQLDDLIVAELKKKMRVKNKVSIMPARDDHGNDKYGSLTKEKIYIHFKFSYWNKQNFDPAIQQDMVLAEIKYITTEMDRVCVSNKLITKEYDLSPVLFSVNGDAQNFSKEISNLANQAFTEVLFPYLNCAHGGSCSKL